MAYASEPLVPGPSRQARWARPGRRWGRRMALPAAAAAAAALLAACGGGSGGGTGYGGSSAAQPQSAAGGSAVVSAHRVAGVGMVLVNHAGMTLYSPRQEASGSIACKASCLGFWFPVTVKAGSAVHAGSGVTGKLATIRRPDDGQTQVTYNGKPLYTFRLDRSPGQVHGNNFTDSFGGTSFNWQAVTASGTAKPAASPSAGGYQNGGGGGGGGYGY